MKINVKEYINTFGCRIFCMKAIRSKFYNNYSNIGVKICLLNENIIKNFLQKNIVDEIKEKNSTDLYFINTDVPKNSIIWTMWWQGLDDAPDIVKACISNLKKKNPSRKVIVITKKNYQQYVHLSSQIIQNLNDKKISITHFSDIYRTNLLYLYGGVWIDSTVWTTEGFDNKLFEKEFYSINTGNYTNDPSHGRWTTFFLEVKANNRVLAFVKECFEIYCRKYDTFLDYILFDYFINIAIDNDIAIKGIFSKIPYNNKRVFELEKVLNNSFDLKFFQEDNTYLYKLTYKKKFLEKSENGSPTFYNMIIRDVNADK